MSPPLPASAAERYECLRAQVVAGGGRREAFAVLLYHGMYHGLAQLASVPGPQRLPPKALPPPADSALIRHLANMILNVQSELSHVY